MKKSLKICIFLGSFFALNFLCKSLTDDFSKDFLIPPAPQDSVWDFKQEPEDLKSLISQKYTYLAKGKQSYVFLSEDKQHVLKLFKPQSPFLEIPFFKKTLHMGLGKIPFMNFFCIDYNSPSFKKTQELEFQSYQNALFLLPKKTLLEYVHLTSSKNLQKKLTLYDKIGILHTIDLDSTSFLIQKKTDLLYPTLANLLKNKEIEKTKQLLENFIEFYFDLIEMKIVNPTTLEKNIGCKDLKPINIDVGRLLRPQDLGMPDSTVPLTQIYHSTSHMKKWLKKRDPQLCSYFEEKITELLEKKKTP